MVEEESEDGLLRDHYINTSISHEIAGKGVVDYFFKRVRNVITVFGVIYLSLVVVDQFIKPEVEPNSNIVNIYTDNQTDCQYLNTKNSGITPRLNRNGVHICD